MNIYSYFFYIRYKFWLKSKKWRNTAQYSSIADITMITWINLLTILFIVDYFLLGNSFFMDQYGRGELYLPVLMCLVILFIIHYFLLIHKKKYKKIIDEYDNKTKNDLGKLKVLFYLYIILTFLIPISFGFLI